jgi:glycosyltransferase involved in cell wall biosynthesis
MQNYFSIICATYKNNLSILKLLNSLSLQKYKNFELIICDQNNGKMIEKIKENFIKKIKIIYMRSKVGLSVSRNLGLKKTKGNYILFLDDDISVPKSFFFKLDKIIKYQKKNDIICYKILNSNKKPFLKYPKKDFLITEEKYIFKYVSSVSFAVKKNKYIKFNNNLGLGSNGIFQSGEETELLLNLYKNNFKFFYSNSIHLAHSDKQLDLKRDLYKNFFYGCGWGYVVKKNYNKKIFLINQLNKVLLNSLFFTLIFNFRKALKSLFTFFGRIYGYITS